MPGESGHSPSVPDRSYTRWLALFAMVLVLLFFAGVRWRLRNMPLERDEGEYAYAGQLILQGIPPYQLAYNMKLPGSYLAYAALLGLFGQTPAGIHVGLLLVNLFSSLLVFFLGRRLINERAGIVAAAAFALFSTSTSVMGLAAHATHFVTLFAVSGTLLVLAARKTYGAGLSFAAGLCMGLAFVMKQPGGVFIAFGLFELAWDAWKQKLPVPKILSACASYCLAAVLPYALTCFWLYRAGVFPRFWFWTVSYARQYATSTGFSEGLGYLGQGCSRIFLSAPILWMLVLAGLVLCIFLRRNTSGLLLRLLAWSFLGASAGLYFREHYFIVMLPVAALLTGLAVDAATEFFRGRGQATAWQLLPAAVFGAGLILAVWTARANLLQRTPDEVVRHLYGGNPFPEARTFGDYIQAHTDPAARILVLGSEPEVYFYAHRRSATGYIYTYGLMEEQKFASQMQREMMQEIEASRPEYVVKVAVAESWLPKAHSDTTILAWSERYLAEEYQVIGAADISWITTYYWNEDAASHMPRTRNSIYLLKRKVRPAS